VHALSRGLLVGVGTTVLGIICALMFLPARAHDHVDVDVDADADADVDVDADADVEDRTPAAAMGKTAGDELAVVGR
jgi:hypothetical protein